MMPPVVTALCSYVPPVVKLDEQVSAIEPTETRPLTGWDAWMALWRTECTPFGPTAMPRIGPGDGPPRAPVAHTTDLSGLAAYVTRAICAALPRAAAPVDVVIFCHSSVDEHISTTTAGRLASVVGARTVHVFRSRFRSKAALPHSRPYDWRRTCSSPNATYIQS